MPVLPIDTGRYGTPEMLKIFEEQARVQRLLDVEAALALAHAEVGDISKKDAEKIRVMASTRYVKVERVKAIEKEIKHDIAALVRALAEVCGSSGTYVHLGATSYDIVDTANALQLKAATEIIEKKLVTLKSILQRQAAKYKATVMIGRTHGQHALPITLGFKFAVWGYEVSRHIERLNNCRHRLVAGKVSGAVGTQASLGEHAARIQELVMKRLGISAAEISTQIVQRDRYAEFVSLLAIIASSLENFATEIRELQRPEIGELSESFERDHQVGSSTMPHKRNPETCERVCGLTRIVRSLTIPALENIVTWHERDLSSPHWVPTTTTLGNTLSSFSQTRYIKSYRLPKAKRKMPGRVPASFNCGPGREPSPAVCPTRGLPKGIRGAYLECQNPNCPAIPVSSA